MVKSKEKSLIIWFCIIVVPVILALTLRVFFIAIYYVSSSSMEPALLSGDIILINKAIYGPRLLKCFIYLRKREVEYFRLKGRSRMKKGDVIIFSMPIYKVSSDTVIDNKDDYCKFQFNYIPPFQLRSTT